MGKKRDRIRMSDDEMWKFIEGQKSLQVATLDKSGAPHLTTLWFAVVDGELCFETFTKSQKVVNLQRDPRIAVLLEDGDTYNELRGVSIQGKAALYTDPDEVHGYALAVMRRNQPEIPADQLENVAKAMAAKRTAVVIKPEKIISWDHRKLEGAY